MHVIFVKSVITNMHSLRAGQQGESSRQLGQWQVKANIQGRLTRIQFSKGHKLADYVGYNIAKASLLRDPQQGWMLTLTLADTVLQP
jgi:hypothetical protein